jgi:hypothetical protein
MSQAQQMQMSRALIQNQIAASARSRGPVGQPLVRPRPGAGRQPSGPRVPDTVFAGTALQQVPIENLGPPSSGVEPADLPPAGPELAPLLSADPLFGDESTSSGRSGPDSPTEGAQIRTTIGQRHNVDLANVRVDRSFEGAAEAHRRGARAFTSDRGVVIPTQAGSLDSGPGEALLAHELTHIAQRVRYGPNVPDESTPAGRLLEADALATEMTLQTGVPTRSAPLEPSGEARRSWAGMLGGGSAGSEVGQTLPLAAPTPSGPDPDALAMSILQRVSGLGAPPPGMANPVTFTPASWSTGPGAAPASTGGGVQRAEEVAPPVADPPTPAPPTPDEPAAGSLTRPSTEDLTRLSQWLYPLIKYRLKGELREDRERAGLLTDHYRRW